MQVSRASQVAIIFMGLIATITALLQASVVFAPVAFALFIIALVWPVQQKLQSRMPPILALALSLVLLVFVFTTFGSLVAWAFGRVARLVINDAARFQAFYTQAMAWLESHGFGVAGMLSETFNVTWLLRAAQTITARINNTMGFWLVVLVYVILGLLEVEDFARKLAGLRNKEVGRALLDGSIQTAEKMRRYMVVRTWMSLVTGVLVWLFAKMVGLQLAAEWGVIAFVLNYIPFLGPLIATVFPTLFAMAQFESWGSVIIVFLCLNMIQFVVGSYIEPRVSGSALAISPVVVLFAVFFWTYVWGIFGAFIGVPIAIAVLTYCAQHPSTRWAADIFGAEEERPEDGALPS